MTAMILVAVLATGCGGKSDSGSTAGNGGDPSQASQEQKELVVWVRDTTASCVEDAAKKYNESHPGVKVTVVEQVNTQIADQFSLALSANEAPDIIALDCTKVPYFASVNAFMDITSRYEALDFKDTFSSGMMKSGQLDGKT